MQTGTWLKILIILSMTSFSGLMAKVMTPGEIKAFAIGYAAAWSSQDPDKLAAHYAEDGLIIVNRGKPSIGRKGIAAKAAGFMKSFPDMKVTLDGLEVKEDKVIFNWRWTGTNSGPGGTGKKLDIRGNEQWTFADNGLIQVSLGTYDRAEYERQMGIEKAK